MLNLSKSEITRNFFVGLIAASLLVVNTTNPSLAKPSNWSYKIGENLRFDFQGCLKSNNDVVCKANFRSRNGEQKIDIGPGWDSNKYVTITNSNGVVYWADEVKIGSDWICKAGSTCGNFNFLPGVGDFTFVEGVDYETTFTFRDVSLPTLKMPLFIFSTKGIFESGIRVRNIDVVDPTSASRTQIVRGSTGSTRTRPLGLSYKLSDALHFNFAGCSKSIDDNDVICTGNFRSYDGERIISVGSGSSITITDSKGVVYNADEIRIGDSFSCRSDRCETSLVEGINYKTLFVFKDASLKSSMIALFYFQSTSEFFGTRFQIKARNIKVSNYSASNLDKNNLDI